MDRRAFLQTGIGALLVGNAAMQGCRTTFATSSGIALSDPSGTWSQNLVRKTRINLTPVMTDMIHTAVWEGPCRFDMLTPSEEMAAAQKRFGEWAADGRSS